MNKRGKMRNISEYNVFEGAIKRKSYVKGIDLILGALSPLIAIFAFLFYFSELKKLAFATAAIFVLIIIRLFYLTYSKYNKMEND
jgi:hypothetical protein